MEISNWNKSRPKTKHFRQFMSSGFLKVIYIRALTGLWMCFMIAAQTDTKVAVHLKILNISNKILTSIPKWTRNQWRDVFMISSTSEKMNCCILDLQQVAQRWLFCTKVEVIKSSRREVIKGFFQAVLRKSGLYLGNDSELIKEMVQ